MNHNAVYVNRTWKPPKEKSKSSAEIDLEGMSYDDLLALKSSNLIALTQLKGKIAKAKQEGFRAKALGNAHWYLATTQEISEAGVLDQRIANRMRLVPRPARRVQRDHHERSKADFFMDVAKQAMGEEDFYSWEAEAGIRLANYRVEMGFELEVAP